MGKITLEDIIDLAKEVEVEDPIPWDMLNISEDDAYRLISLSVYEMYSHWKAQGNAEVIMLSTLIKLVVENFALNLKLKQGDN